MIKPIAIYLPQFHPIPENNKAWGEGFTEWTNVKKAKPLFEGHYQPHIPHESIGYYDLRDPEVLVKQAAIAKEYGIFGFAFYHYWFNGLRLLETPLDNMLKFRKPDFPFLYIWANEPWSRKWDGSTNHLIQEQSYSPDDDKSHIRFLCNHVFNDKRYIKIEDKPIFIVYRTELLPNINRTVDIWREEALKHGFNGLFLIRVENFVQNINPGEIGFDAALEFAPDWESIDMYNSKRNSINNRILHDYTLTTMNMLLRENPDFIRFRCIFPGWDNTPRRPDSGSCFINNSPVVFGNFLYRTIEYTKSNINENMQFIFINAWNEWGEGCHLEPDIKFGYSFLEEIKKKLNTSIEDNMLNYISFLERNVKTYYLNDRLEFNSVRNYYNKLLKSKKFRVFKSIIETKKKLIFF